MRKTSKKHLVRWSRLPNFYEAHLKIRFKALTLRQAQCTALILLAVILVSACAPAVTSVPSTAEVPTQVLAPELPTPTVTLQPTLAPVETAAVPTQTVEVQAVATSRGPDLEATDPTTVSLASGKLQLVEFFRFT